MQDLCGKALFLAQKAEQEVFGANVLVREALCFLSSVGQHALAFIGERQIDGSGYFLADGGVALDLLTNRVHGSVRAEKAVGQRLVLTQQAEQQVLGLNIGRAKLAGLVSCKEDDATCLFCIAFEHISPEKTFVFVEARIFRRPSAKRT